MRSCLVFGRVSEIVSWVGSSGSNSVVSAVDRLEMLTIFVLLNILTTDINDHPNRK